MKVLNLKFDKETSKNRILDGSEWKPSYDRESDQLSLMCSVDPNTDKVVKIHATEALANEWKKKHNVNFRDMYLVPLYRHRLIQLATEPQQKESVLVHVVAEAGKQISSIKLEGCALSERIVYDENRTRAAFAVVQLDYSVSYIVKIFQNDGTLIVIENGKVSTKKVKHEIIMPKFLKATQLLVMPKKTLLTNNPKEVKKDGYITVFVAAVLSPISIIKEKEDTVEYLMAPDVTEQQVAQMAAKLTKPLKYDK